MNYKSPLAVKAFIYQQIKSSIPEDSESTTSTEDHVNNYLAPAKPPQSNNYRDKIKAILKNEDNESECQPMMKKELSESIILGKGTDLLDLEKSILHAGLMGKAFGK